MTNVLSYKYNKVGHTHKVDEAILKETQQALKEAENGEMLLSLLNTVARSMSENRPVVSDFCKEASNWIEDNKYDAAKLMKANNWGSGDIESDYKFLQTYNFKVTDEQMEKTLNQVINDYKEFGIITKDVSTQDILNKIYKPRKVK